MKMKKSHNTKILDLFDGRTHLHSSTSQDKSRYNSIKSRVGQSLTAKNKQNNRDADCFTERNHQVHQIQDFQVLLNLKTNARSSQPKMLKSQSSFSMQTFVRFRPFTLQQLRSDFSSQIQNVKIIDSNGVRVNGSLHRFDQVFTPESKDLQIYERCGKKLIDHCLNGYNATIFAYGQTGSGKTFTMFGSGETRKGIVPLALEHIWNKIQFGQKELITVQHNNSFRSKGCYSTKISCSMLQIYRQNLYDLLSDNSSSSEILKIKQTSTGFQVSGLNINQVQSYEEMVKLVNHGHECKRIRETSLNEISSRSHLILTVYLQSQVSQHEIRRSKLNLIDLAGSEKVSKSKVQGEGLQQAKKINLSLSVLSNTINALVKGQDHIPFRQSKLTKLLNQSLGGNSLTSLIVTCSMHESCSEQTISSLKFANRAKKVRNNPTPNIIKIKGEDRLIDRFLYESLKHSLEHKQEILERIGKIIQEHDSASELDKSKNSARTIDSIRSLTKIDTNESKFKKKQITQESSHFVRHNQDISQSNSKRFQMSLNSTDTFNCEGFNPMFHHHSEESNIKPNQNLQDSSDRKHSRPKIHQGSQCLTEDISKSQQKQVSRGFNHKRGNNQISVNSPIRKQSSALKAVQSVKVRITKKGNKLDHNIYQTPQNNIKQIEQAAYKVSSGLISSMKELVNSIQKDKKQYCYFERQVLCCQIEELMNRVPQEKKMVYAVENLNRNFVEGYINLLESNLAKILKFISNRLETNSPGQFLKQNSISSSLSKQFWQSKSRNRQQSSRRSKEWARELISIKNTNFDNFRGNEDSCWKQSQCSRPQGLMEQLLHKQETIQRLINELDKAQKRQESLKQRQQSIVSELEFVFIQKQHFKQKCLFYDVDYCLSQEFRKKI